MNDIQRYCLTMAIIGFIMGVFIEFSITIMINMGCGDISPIARNLSERYGDVGALVIQIVLPGLMGAVNFASTFVYESDRLNLITATFIHASIVIISVLSVGSFMGWFELTPASVVVFLALIIVIYFMIWFLMYTKSKTVVKEINEALERRQQRE